MKKVLAIGAHFDDVELQEGDGIMFASVGAGMNINAVGYIEP